MLLRTCRTRSRIRLNWFLWPSGWQTFGWYRVPCWRYRLELCRLVEQSSRFLPDTPEYPHRGCRQPVPWIPDRTQSSTWSARHLDTDASLSSYRCKAHFFCWIKEKDHVKIWNLIISNDIDFHWIPVYN